MSTRGLYTFIDGDNSWNVYRHSDNYPTGAKEAIDAALACGGHNLRRRLSRGANAMKPYAIGERVRLTNVRHLEFRGLVGTVRRFIKTREIVEVKLDDGRLYDAYPQHLERATS